MKWRQRCQKNNTSMSATTGDQQLAVPHRVRIVARNGWHMRHRTVFSFQAGKFRHLP